MGASITFSLKRPMNRSEPLRERLGGRRMLRGLWSLLILFSLSGAAAATPLLYDPHVHGQGYSLLEHLEVLPLSSEEPPEALAAAPAGSNGWQSLPRLGIVDYHLRAVWLRFTAEAKAEEPHSTYFIGTASYTDLIEVYKMVAGRAVLQQRLGEFVPDYNYQYRLPMVPLRLDAEPQTYLIRVASRGPLNLNFMIWDQETFNKEQRGPESLFLGLLFGFVLVMIAYNTFLAIRLQSRTYWLYVAYIVGFGIVQFIFTGTAHQLLPASGFKEFFVNQGLIYTAELCAIFASLFAISFLDLKENNPRLVQAIKLFFLASVGNMLVCLVDFNLSVRVVFLTNAYVSSLLLYAGVRRSLDRYRPAYFYTGAWAFIILGSLATMMRIYGYFPDSGFTAWSQFVGGAFEVVLLSLALGDKISLAQERAHAQISQLNLELHEANSKLKKHIEDVEAIVEEKTRDIRSIMEHIPLGVFMIRRDESLHKDFSRLLPQIFKLPAVEKQNAVELVFTDAALGADAVHQAVSTLRTALGESSTNFDLNSHLLPSSIRRPGPGGQLLTYDLTWNVITDEEDLVDKVLVTLRDVTEIRRLESEARDQREELQFIGEILNIPAPRFLRFIQTCRDLIFENARLIHAEGVEKRNSEVLKLLFINMHTIKGSARSLYLKRMTEIFHSIENYYAHLQKDPQAFWDQGKMERDLEEAKKIVALYETIAREKLGRSLEQSHIALFPTSQVEFAYRKISEWGRESYIPSDLEADFSHIKSLFFHKVFVDSREIMSDLLGCLPVLAKDLQKDLPEVHLETGGILLNDSGDELFRNIFVHLLRNSMDHGIEGPAERRSRGKPQRGTISISFEKRGEQLYLIYGDDGRGLHLSRICDIARARRLVSPSASLGPSDIAELIFNAGLSTADRLTEISGRGVGMGAVRSFVEQKGGSISVLLHPYHGLEPSFRSFHFQIILPFYELCELPEASEKPDRFAS